PEPREQVAQRVGARLPLLADDLDDLGERAHRRLPVGERLGHREVQPALARAPGDEDVRVRLPASHRGHGRVGLVPLAPADEQHAPRGRVEVVRVRPEALAAARLGVGAEDRGDRPALGGVASQRGERAPGVAVALELVLGAEALAEVAHEQLADLVRIVDDAENRADWLVHGGSGEGVAEAALDEHADELLLVLDTAVCILDRTGRLRGELAGPAQRVGVAGRGARQLCFDPHRARADGADRDARVGDRSVLDAHRAGDRRRRPLVEGELAMGDSCALRRERDPHRAEELAVRERGLVRADEELGERPPRALVLDLRVECEQERGGVGVGVREAEVAAEGAHVADADVRDAALHPRERRQALEHERRALDLAVGGGRADHERSVLGPDAPELLDSLEVDEVTVGGEAELQQQQQLCAAADRRRLVPVADEQLARLLDRRRAVQVERRQRQTGASASSAPRKSRRPFRLSTRSTAASSSPLTRTLAISTTGWWKGTSVPNRTRVSPTRSYASRIFVCIGIPEVSRYTFGR